MPPPRPLIHTRSHDYGHLVRRWRAVARRRGWKMEPYTAASGYELFLVETRRPDPARPWIYVSAGIHGDESGSTEALLTWAASTAHAGAFNVLAFPCLNPWGLVNNMRTDENGRDLNRSYHNNDVPQTAIHREIMARHRYAAAFMLHEDYDATGAYVYEVRQRRPFWGERMLAAAAAHVPVERRRSIEGRPCRHGVVRRKVDPAAFPTFPEAFPLHLHYSDRTFTNETPSEAALDDRVAAHVAILDAALDLCLTRPPARPRPNS